MESVLKLMVTFSLALNFSNAQTTVIGKLINHKNKPVIAAILYLDSTATQVATNKLGEYSLAVPENVKTLKVHSKKYGWLTSAYATETKIYFMYLDTAPFAATSVITYNGLKKYQDVNTDAYRTIFDLIRGRIAGVVVQKDNTNLLGEII